MRETAAQQKHINIMADGQAGLDTDLMIKRSRSERIYNNSLCSKSWTQADTSGDGYWGIAAGVGSFKRVGEDNQM